MSKPLISSNLLPPQIGDFRLFLIFLMIGATSFGGFMALISIVQKEIVNRRKLVQEEVVVDAVSVASLLPGPLAVNVVACIGYHINGLKGSLLCMLGVIIPSFLLIVILSYLYFSYGSVNTVENIFLGVMPAVVAIILSVAIQMLKKVMANRAQISILIFSGLILFWVGGFITTILILVASGIFGLFFFYEEKFKFDGSPRRVVSDFFTRRKMKMISISKGLLILFFGFVVCFLIVFFVDLSGVTKLVLLKDILVVFSTISVTLFGGGYIFIPSMQEVMVSNLQWVSLKEFTDGIALGQLTPGPIMITATFIGFKVAGIPGASLATLGMFVPPALLAVFTYTGFHSVKESKIIISAFKGVRPAVVGMIFSAAGVIATNMPMTWEVLTIFLFSILMIYLVKVSAVLLILCSAVLGFLLF